MAKAYRVTFTPFKPPTSGGTRASPSAKVKNFRCAACSTVDTTVLRRGPSGPKTLCNRFDESPLHPVLRISSGAACATASNRRTHKR